MRYQPLLPNFCRFEGEKNPFFQSVPQPSNDLVLGLGQTEEGALYNQQNSL